MLKKFFGLTVGSLIYSLAIALFIDVHGLAPGGIGGIAILISRVVPFLDTGAWILILNIPLLIVGLVVFGKTFLVSTVYTTVVSSILVDIISKIASPWLPFTDNMILAAVAGGGMLALGIGIVFRSGGTTGGVDILVKILRRKFRHMRTGALFMSVDVFVVIMTIPVMGSVEAALYSTVALVTVSVVLDKVLYGTEGGTLFYIVTDHPKEIAGRILAEVDVGCTYLDGEGAYTGAPKRVILCVARKQLAPKIRDVVKAEDPGAFLIVSPATEVLGLGFKPHGADEL